MAFTDSTTAHGNGLVMTSQLLLLAMIGSVAMLSSPASAMPASLVRIARVADSISAQLLGLLLICVLFGLNIVADRRRRARAPSSYS